MFPADGETLDFYAYYPYVENVDPSAIAYDATQSMCDLLMARTGGVDNSTETVTLTFSHQLSLVGAQVTLLTAFHPRPYLAVSSLPLPSISESSAPTMS